MHRKKRIAGLLTALLLAAAITGCSTTATTAVSGSKDTASDLIASYEQGGIDQSEFYERLLSESGMTVMLEMVDKGILDVIEPVTDEMKATVEENLASIKEYYGEDFEKALESNGFKSEEVYSDALYLNLQRNAYIIKHVEKNILTSDEIQAYYDDFEPEVEASHILIKPEGDADADWASAENTAKELITRFEAGEDFAELAKEYSDDPGSGMAGGALGSFGKGRMVPEFEAAAFGLETGGHTAEPVRTQFGYHIILKTGGGEKASFEDMKDEIVKTLAEGKLQADESLGFKALVQMREENGFDIQNDVLDVQYTNMKDDINKAK